MAETAHTTKDVYGYTRVSTISQKHEIQKKAIIDFAEYRKLNILRIFSDSASGKNTSRDGYAEMYEAMRNDPRKVAAIVVTKIDRLGRNLRDLIEFVHWLDQHGIGLIILESNIDTTTSEGRLFFHFMASIAEYERIRILERTTAGRLAAIEKGIVFGAPRKELNVDNIQHDLIMGVPLAAIARDLKVSRATIYRRLDEHKAERATIQQ